MIGVVLAGGESRRMGTDKAALPFGDGTLLDHMAELLAKAGAGTVVVSGPARDGKLRAIADSVPAAGPVGGLFSVAAALSEESDGAVLLVTAVDMPALSAAALVKLKDAVAAGARAAHYQGAPLPLALRLEPTALAALAATAIGATPGADRSLQRFLREAGAKRLPGSAPGLRSVNTPEEWAALRSSRP